MRKQWATSPNIRGLAQDYPIDEPTPRSALMFSAVGGSMLIFAGLATDAAIGLRVRSLDGVADGLAAGLRGAAPVLRAKRPRFRRVRDGRRPGLSARRRGSAPAAPPLGAEGSRWHGPTAAWAGTGGPSRTRSCRSPMTGAISCVQRGTCQQGCGEGAKASTDLTHWPKAIAAGARLVTGARVRRLETNAKGLVTGPPGWTRPAPSTSSRHGRRRGRERDRHRAAAAVSASGTTRTASPTRRGWSASG